MEEIIKVRCRTCQRPVYSRGKENNISGFGLSSNKHTTEGRTIKAAD